MLRFTILCVGKIKEAYMREAVSDYTRRLTKYGKIEIVETNEDISVKKEGEALLARLQEKSYVFALDLKGKMCSSPELARMLERQATSGYSHFTFIIGGSDGLSSDVTERADCNLCLSPMTFPHQMARLILLEQIYRAMKINHGEKYHK